MEKTIIMLEEYNEETGKGSRYEFKLVPIKESNVSDRIVRYEFRYDYTKCFGTGGTKSYNNRLMWTLDEHINRLVSMGFKEVTYQTQRFA